MALVQRLDHKVLLPEFHPLIKVIPSTDGKEVTSTFEDRRWVFPSEDCEIMPLANTTAELIADWFGRELIASLKLDEVPTVQTLTVSVEENFGQWATVELNV